MVSVHKHVQHASVGVDLPVRIESELNTRDHWRTRQKRFREQKEAVFYSLANFAPLLKLIAAEGAGILVTFTRFGPRLLDDDNLLGGFKACRDQVAKQLGIDDGDPRIRFVYQQEKSRTYSARVLIERRSA